MRVRPYLPQLCFSALFTNDAPHQHLELLDQGISLASSVRVQKKAESTKRVRNLENFGQI